MNDNKINIKDLWDNLFNELLELDCFGLSSNNHELYRNISKIYQISKILDIVDNENDIKIKYYQKKEVDNLIKQIEVKFNLKYEFVEDEKNYNWKCELRIYKQKFILSKLNNVLYWEDDNHLNNSKLIQSNEEAFGMVDNWLLTSYGNQNFNEALNRISDELYRIETEIKNKKYNFRFKRNYKRLVNIAHNLNIYIDDIIEYQMVETEDIILKLEKEFDVCFSRNDENQKYVWEYIKNNNSFRKIYDKFLSVVQLKKTSYVCNKDEKIEKYEYIDNLFAIEMEFRSWLYDLNAFVL